MLFGQGHIRIETERLVLTLPNHADFQQWVQLRQASASFLTPWEPAWDTDHLSRARFAARVRWARRGFRTKRVVALFMKRQKDNGLLGAITLDDIRFDPAHMGTLSYWIGQPFARQGYMGEAIAAVVHFAFHRLDLSRIEAACLPSNAASRRVLEKNGFKYEGVAQNYLQINGRWRTHLRFACLRSDRRGKGNGEHRHGDQSD